VIVNPFVLGHLAEREEIEELELLGHAADPDAIQRDVDSLLQIDKVHDNADEHKANVFQATFIELNLLGLSQVEVILETMREVLHRYR
jgi:hypothetical protein